MLLQLWHSLVQFSPSILRPLRLIIGPLLFGSHHTIIIRELNSIVVFYTIIPSLWNGLTTIPRDAGSLTFGGDTPLFLMMVVPWFMEKILGSS